LVGRLVPVIGCSRSGFCHTLHGYCPWLVCVPVCLGGWSVGLRTFTLHLVRTLLRLSCCLRTLRCTGTCRHYGWPFGSVGWLYHTHVTTRYGCVGDGGLRLPRYVGYGYTHAWVTYSWLRWTLPTHTRLRLQLVTLVGYYCYTRRIHFTRLGWFLVCGFRRYIYVVVTLDADVRFTLKRWFTTLVPGAFPRLHTLPLPFGAGYTRLFGWFIGCGCGCVMLHTLLHGSLFVLYVLWLVLLRCCLPLRCSVYGVYYAGCAVWTFGRACTVGWVTHVYSTTPHGWTYTRSRG